MQVFVLLMLGLLVVVYLLLAVRRWAIEARRNIPDPKWQPTGIDVRFTGFDAVAYERGRQAFVRRQIRALETKLPERRMRLIGGVR
jgi:hypothetical protein